MFRTLTALTASTLFAALLTGSPAARADNYGVANYASYLDDTYVGDAVATLEEQLASTVQIAQVQIDGDLWIRLQSDTLEAAEAKRLVARATAAGYQAWYQSAEATNPVASETKQITRSSNPLPLQTIVTSQRSKGIENADPDLVAQLPEGPLLGDLYPPRSPVPKESAR